MSGRGPTSAPPPVPSAPAVIPRRIGSYDIVRKLAEGGMAEIFLAARLVIDDDGSSRREACVLKRMIPTLAPDLEISTMFRDEARLASGFDHPNIPRVLDVGESEGTPFFVMEFLSGQDAWHLLRSAGAKNEAIPFAQIISIGAGACAALHYAHEFRDASGRPLHIVHRDVSPQNIFVTHEGVTKLCDFGIAKSRIQQAKTRAGVLKGKVRYMSPEQCRGWPLDGRSDVFSLSIVLWHLLTLRRLYSADTDREIATQILNEPPPPPSSFRPDIPAALEAIVMRGLSLRAEDRFRTAAEMGAALEALAQRSSPAAPQADLASFISTRFGAPLPSLDASSDAWEVATFVDPSLAALDWFEVSPENLAAAEKSMLIHLPGMHPLADLEPLADELAAAAAAPPADRGPIPERLSSIGPIPVPVRVPIAAPTAAPSRSYVDLVVMVIVFVLGLGALWWTFGRPSAKSEPPAPAVPAAQAVAPPAVIAPPEAPPTIVAPPVAPPAVVAPTATPESTSPAAATPPPTRVAPLPAPHRVPVRKKPLPARR